MINSGPDAQNSEDDPAHTKVMCSEFHISRKISGRLKNRLRRRSFGSDESWLYSDIDMNKTRKARAKMSTDPHIAPWYTHST